MLPEFEPLISEAENPFVLWIELMLALKEAYESAPPNEALISNVYRYARWCREYSSPLGDDLHQAVYINFFQGLSRHAPMRVDIPRRMSATEMESLAGEFLFHFWGSDEQDRVMRDIFGPRGRELRKRFEKKLRRAREGIARKSQK
jgi:hypothetical protein